ncbi:MAG: hypothetical protein ACOY45_05850 [Pseudomonadota bacterium]
MSPQDAGAFYLPWTAALAAAAAEPRPIAAIVLHLPGLELPLIQSVLAVAGVLIARPLARKKEAALPLSHFLAVTLAMLIVAIAWVSESRPGVLFTFVVALGLGFSGYTLIELVGTEVEAFVKRIVAQAADAIKFGGKAK